MSDVVALLQARTTSTRFPGKVLKPILGVPMLARQIERVRRAKLIDNLVVATSDDESDNDIACLCHSIGVDVHRGSLLDVLDRMTQAARFYEADWIVRLTGDCPLTDPGVIDAAIEMAVAGEYDYVSNALEPTYPDGVDVEVLRAPVLECAWKEAKLASEREHVTPFIYKRPCRFRIGQLKAMDDSSHLRLTVDEPRDFELVSEIYERLYPCDPAFSLDDVLELMRREPELAARNAGYVRNEGYLKSIGNEKNEE